MARLCWVRASQPKGEVQSLAEQETSNNWRAQPPAEGGGEELGVGSERNYRIVKVGKDLQDQVQPSTQYHHAY